MPCFVEVKFTGTDGPLETEPMYGRAKFLTGMVETIETTIGSLKAAMKRPEEKW